MATISTDIVDRIKAVDWRDRIDISASTPQHPGNILKADVLVFARNGMLSIGKITDQFIALVAKEVHFQGGDSTCVINLPSGNGVNGNDGVAGLAGNNMDRNGGVGGDGQAGENGKTPPDFFFYAERITFSEAPTGDKPPLVVVANGGDAGDGGDGGRGGNGDDGHDYYKGFGTIGPIIP